MRRVVTLPNPWSVTMVTIPVAGQLLGLSERSAYRAVSRGDIPTVLPGRVSVFALYVLLGAPIPARPFAPVVGGGRR